MKRKRYVPLYIPGDREDDGTWFVYDHDLQRSVRVGSYKEAKQRARELNPNETEKGKTQMDSSEIDAIKEWRPRLAKSGVSIDFGPVRIRMEAAGTLELRKYIASRITIALALCQGKDNNDLA